MNRPYILTRRNLNPSAKALAGALGLKKSFEPLDQPPNIRWGNSEGDFDEEGDTQFNDPYSIAFCGNKVKFSDEMKSAQIPHVELAMYQAETFPVVVRTSLSASKGEGIVICENAEEFAPYRRNYWSPWYNFESEYGIHLLGGKIVKLFKKVREEGLEPEKYPLRNMERGYHFKRMDIDGESKFPRLKKFMQEVYEKFPLEMGRWDVGFDSRTREYMVIEANSAPGIAENEDTLKMYVQFLRENLRGEL